MAQQIPGMPDSIYKDYMRDPRLLQGQTIGQAGTQTTPVGSPLEALSRVLQGALGGFMVANAKGDADQRSKDYGETMARALRAGQGQENTFDPATGQWSSPTGKADENSARLMARVLANNADTAPMGMQMQMSDIDTQRKLAQALALDKAKREGAAPTTRTYEDGGKKVTQEWVPGAGWKNVGSAEVAPRNVQTVTTADGVYVLGTDGKLGARLGGRPSEKEPQTGPFAGTSMDAQASNILLTGDPTTPAYRAAYNILAAPRSTVDSQTGDIITTRPDMSAFRAPVMGSPSAPAPMPAPGSPPQMPMPGAPAQPSEPMPPQPMNAQPSAPQAPTGSPVQSINVPGQNVTITPGGQGRMTEAQTRDATFADRIAQAEDVLSRFDTQGTNFWQNVAAERAPLGSASLFTTPEYQQYDQAKRDFVNAVLRKESGAVINPDEFKNAEKQYFPQPGDSPEVIEQKRRNRASQMQGMQRAAGPVYQRNLPSKDKDTLYNKYGLEGR